MDFRVGMGYDVHRLTENRSLIIGGVRIPFEKGLLGHSDADVLIHAIMDGLTGAVKLGDIGRLFPDNDPAYEGADSRVLLRQVNSLLKEKGFRVVNVDGCIIAQRPKMMGYISEMEKNIAEDLEIDIDRINIKATTEEGLGFTGSGEGIAAQAVVLTERVESK
ncbi:MAG: 2-C-methyl-D-erythritol 2,4-cyclodiphosphate synthase [Clostridiales bacterium]|nr:2-C-methyl-D-erythritol 2,4-cyclodiphosphate synthase [Clostridiales bacterium]MCD8158616.1 2-C-methyl-D-erythritol 2,4-cyclodiphosphate synthase [Clostridiales bacterium]